MAAALPLPAPEHLLLVHLAARGVAGRAAPVPPAPRLLAPPAPADDPDGLGTLEAQLAGALAAQDALRHAHGGGMGTMPAGVVIAYEAYEALIRHLRVYCRGGA
ncbi:hypothetical protein tb265_38910 [Gemmatimonadetes bacterium T265]|nr:hypothetical protein tb265_38910 [Gemmatimonadetes bacterium T265]